MLKQIENLTEEEIIEIVKCSTGMESINSIVLAPFSKINRDNIIKMSYSFIESSDKVFKAIRGDVSICYFNEDNLSNNKNDADYLCDVYFEILWDYSIVLLVMVLMELYGIEGTKPLRPFNGDFIDIEINTNQKISTSFYDMLDLIPWILSRFDNEPDESYPRHLSLEFDHNNF